MKNADLMWKQSVWTSTIAAHLAAKHLNENGLLVLTGAHPAQRGTAGRMLSYLHRKYFNCSELWLGYIVYVLSANSAASSVRLLVFNRGTMQYSSFVSVVNNLP